ncbi:hypothetical protein QOZ80_7BG0588950 [Eleusine coracana subsp. coracana]|nr:hypothetical protein QOZ80_7BG0588950 [Eleusine coracana subsp. coracana]
MASQGTPSKRPFQKNSSDHGGRGKWKKAKHANSQHAQLKIRAGVPVFRVLCPASKSGNVIGKGGSVIAKIRQETGAKITVEEAVIGCNERVIFITATVKERETNHKQDRENEGGVSVPAGGDSEKYKDKDCSKEENDDSDGDHGKEEKDDLEKDSSKEEMDDSDKHSSKEDNDHSERDIIKQETDDSAEHHLKEIHDSSEKDNSKEEKNGPLAAKDTKPEPVREIPAILKALLLVFDRIFATEDENETGDASDARHPVSMRLLVLYSQAGWLVGKNGSVIKQMSVDNSCEIRVSKDKLPSCALSQDRICQIIGEVESVRKGLNAVAEVLFAHPPKESDVAAGAHLSGSSSHSLYNRSDGLSLGMQPNFHIPFQGPSQANGPFDITDHRSNVAPFPTLPEAQVHGHAAVPVEVEPLTFRLLCSRDKVGSIIGKGGNVVNNIQKDTGCEIKVLETVPKSENRIIRISGPAHPGDGISPAQNAILHVQRKIVSPSSDKESPAICRLVVSPNQVGCLLGRGGVIISEMRKLSGAHIVVLSKDKIPKGVPQNDEVIQISGDCEPIQEALMQITARLRNHLFRDRMPAVGPNMQSPFGLIDSQFGSYMGSHESPSLFPKDFMGRPLDAISAPWTMKGIPDGDKMSMPEIPGAAHRGLGGFAGPGQSSLVPNLTAEVLVPRLLIHALGDGGCLDRICEFSEAKITVAEPLVDAMDTAVLISGTPDQMHAARSLIQAFVLSESFIA